MDSVYKLIDYVAKLSKEPISMNGVTILEKPVEQVTLTDKFFIKDDCTMCGRCCPNENTAYTRTNIQDALKTVEADFTKWGLDIKAKDELFNGMEEVDVDLNGNHIIMYSHPKDTPLACNRITYPDRPANLERCHWLFEKDGTYRCRIHPCRSITCGMPHLRFFYNQQTHHTSLGLSQFGRNCALGCPVDFMGTGYPVDEESTQSRIHWLQLLEDSADDMQIQTFLPEILYYLESGHRKPREFVKSGRRKLF